MSLTSANAFKIVGESAVLDVKFGKIPYIRWRRCLENARHSTTRCLTEYTRFNERRAVKLVGNEKEWNSSADGGPTFSRECSRHKFRIDW